MRTFSHFSRRGRQRVVGLLLLAVAVFAGPGKAATADFVEGELLVKFAGGASGAVAEQVRAIIKHEVRQNFDFIGWQHVRLPAGMTVEQGLSRYRALPGVLAVERNIIYRHAGVMPNDPRFQQQYALTRIAATNAWSVSTGSQSVVVAVLDSGINYNHEDLAANMWSNSGEIPGNRRDDDGNGHIDDIHGTDTATDRFGQDGDPLDQGISGFYHGTACAGIIGAVGNNGVGISGLNWAVQLMAIRVANTNDTIPMSSHLGALAYVRDMKMRGVDVRAVNMSYGGTNESFAATQALSELAALGIVSVAAAHNFSQNIDVRPFYPACANVPAVLSVAASDSADALAVFSNYGATNVDLAAPGVTIVTTSGETTSAYYQPGVDGTSFAAPYVAGAVALMCAARPAAAPTDIKQALLATVDVRPAFTNRMVSNGRLNVERALEHLGRYLHSPPAFASQPPNRSVVEGQRVSWSVTNYGSEPFFYQWQFGGTPLPAATNSSFAVTNAATEHAGEYAVVVSNAFGTVTSEVARLTVLLRPRLVWPTTPFVVSAVPGERITLNAQTTGALPITYRWRHIRTNGTSVNLATQVLDEHTSFFTFTAAANSAGAYTLVLTNPAEPSSGLQRTNILLRMLADSDSDGLPDAWELSYPQASDAAGDFDGDGFSNLAEYRAGTDPLESQSVLRLDNVQVAEGAAAFEFFGVSNRSYTVEYRSNQVSAPWRQLARLLARTTNGTVYVQDTNGPAAIPQRFYRLALP